MQEPPHHTQKNPLPCKWNIKQTKKKKNKTTSNIAKFDMTYKYVDKTCIILPFILIKGFLVIKKC